MQVFKVFSRQVFFENFSYLIGCLDVSTKDEGFEALIEKIFNQKECFLGFVVMLNAVKGLQSFGITQELFCLGFSNRFSIIKYRQG
jgi:hypothetical protein